MRLGRHLSALAATTLALLAGIWLMLAPWVLGYPRPAGAWGSETLTDFWSGLGIVVVAAVTLVLYGAGLTADLRRAGVIAPRAAPAPPLVGEASLNGMNAVNGVGGAAARPPIQGTGPSDPAGGATADFEELLVPLATALLSDLVKRRGAAGTGPTPGDGGEQG